jgi:hypothetical protein
MNDKNRSVSQLVEKNHAKISESFKLERKFLPNKIKKDFSMLIWCKFMSTGCC